MMQLFNVSVNYNHYTIVPLYHYTIVPLYHLNNCIIITKTANYGRKYHSLKDIQICSAHH